MKSQLDIHGTVMDSHKFAYAFYKNHEQLCKIYVIIVYKPHKIHVTLDGHWRKMNARNLYELRISCMNDERPTFHTWKLHKMYRAAPLHGLRFNASCLKTFWSRKKLLDAEISADGSDYNVINPHSEDNFHPLKNEWFMPLQFIM